MKSNVLFKTTSGNKYLYSPKVNQFLLIHPALHYLIKLHNQGVNLNCWLADLKSDKVEIASQQTFTKKEMHYYYEKFRLLASKGYFSEINNDKRLSGRITGNQIYEILANVPQVLFEVTDRCNLCCVYCGYGKYYEDYDKRENKDLDIGKAFTLLHYLLKLWNSPLNASHHIKINIGFYGGEPLLNFSFIKKMVKYIKGLKPVHNTFSFGMTTNGLLLGKYMDFLVENEFKLLISLDGNKTHNGYRVFPDGNESYDRVQKKILALKEKYPDFFNRHVDFNTVLHNKNSISGIYRYFKKNFNKMPIISELSTDGVKETKKEEFWNIYKDAIRDLKTTTERPHIEDEMFLNLPNIQSLNNVIRRYSGYSFSDYNEFLCPSQDRKRIPTGTCLPFSKRLYLTINGKLLPCERIGHQYALGKVDKGHVEIDGNEIANKMNTYFDKMRNRCSMCYDSESCIRCIFSLEPERKDPICGRFMNINDFTQYLSDQISKLEEKPHYYSKIMEKVVTL
jgi:uncharacterized protein